MKQVRIVFAVEVRKPPFVGTRDQVQDGDTFGQVTLTHLALSQHLPVAIGPIWRALRREEPGAEGVLFDEIGGPEPPRARRTLDLPKEPRFERHALRSC